MKQPKTIAFVNDLHVGSHWALWPRDWLPSNKRLHKGPRYLLDCFDQFVDWLPSQIDLLYLNGDLIEGDARKSKATGLFSAKLGDQVDGAIEILEPLVKKCKKVARVHGTPYHEDHHEPLKAFDKEFKIRQSRQSHWLKLNQGWMSIAHHPCSGAVLYEGTAVDKEGLWSSIAASKNKVYETRWIIRAHKHNYIYQETEDKIVIISPCWKLQDPYAAKQNFWKFHPSIGGFYLTLDENSRFDYSIRAKFFDVPKPVGYTWSDL